VHEADELATEETPFPAETLARLADLVPCDGIGVFEVDRVRRRHLPLDGEQDERWWEIAHQQPICNYVEETGDFRALKVSDFLTGKQLHRLELYDDYFRPSGFEYWMMLPLVSPPSHEQGFNFYRSRPDFSGRDRDLLDILAPHLLRLTRTVELRRRLRAALAALDSGDVDPGLLLLNPDGHLDHVTPRARALLGKYFPAARTSLPPTVAEWLGHSQEPFIRARGPTRIVVDRLGETLLLREEPAEAAKVASLTPREQQVLVWLANGKTNAEIARILVTAPGTVRKHLEHIYGKLGVHTRTAAAAYARPKLVSAA
jgi:DNA-binding CsgD family transcriptional regulator